MAEVLLLHIRLTSGARAFDHDLDPPNTIAQPNQPNEPNASNEPNQQEEDGQAS